MRKQGIALLLLMATGAIVTATGLLFFYTYSTNYSNNLQTISTSINAGWSTRNVSDPTISVRLTPPDSFGNSGAVLSFLIRGFVDTESSQTIFFSFLAPITISESLNQSGSDLSSTPGTWSFQNVGDNASVIHYTVSLSGCSIIPCFDDIDSTFTVLLSTMPYINDHGHHTIVLPFGGGLPFGFGDGILPPNSLSFQEDLSKNISFMLVMDTGNTIVDSFPHYDGESTLSYGGKGLAAQLFAFGLMGSQTLTVRYDNSHEIGSNENLQSFGLLFFGIGVPIVITSPFEYYRSAKSK